MNARTRRKKLRRARLALQDARANIAHVERLNNYQGKELDKLRADLTSEARVHLEALNNELYAEARMTKAKERLLEISNLVYGWREIGESPEHVLDQIEQVLQRPLPG